ncbi:42351_t:CDS:1, partial [Gigaspora margarita]
MATLIEIAITNFHQTIIICTIQTEYCLLFVFMSSIDSFNSLISSLRVRVS